MTPIYEQGSGKGIGHSFQSFSERFSELCEQHLREHRARAFAFIFYDFDDRDFKRVLKNQGVFAKLDRLSGDRLSIFYLHSGSRYSVKHFNSQFLARLSLEEQVALPCIVFFKVKQAEITDVAALHLESADLIHGFDELQAAITRFISEAASAASAESMYWRWIKSGTKFIGIEAFRAWLREAFRWMI